MATARPRIVVAGAGIAGSLIASGLAERSDIELICAEKAAADDHADAGTGLNIGPNALKSLGLVMPERARMLTDNSLPWRRWTIGLTDGRQLVDFSLDDLAENPGIRIRWAELYALLRDPISARIRFGSELTGVGQDASGTSVEIRDTASGRTDRLDGIDLLIGADGRYSAVRSQLVGADPPRFLGVCLYRLLFPAGPDCPIDDYGQWFNGSSRLLAFRVPGGFVYCAGSFPIGADGVVPELMKTAAGLRAAYTPATGALSTEAEYLVSAIEGNLDRIHWARLQDGTVRYDAGTGVLLAGDAAHPMVPTLGQGATQSVEDACVIVDELRRALDRGLPLVTVPKAVRRRREERVRFVVEFSREATDTMLAGSDPVAGSLRKAEPAFVSKLHTLYRQAPGRAP